MMGETVRSDSIDSEALSDDLSREVYCILGMPIDAIDLPSVLARLNLAAAARSMLFLSTPNLNYLVHCHSDVEFRDSLLLSNLCPADGAPIVWLGRLLGVPIKERVAGSDIFAALKSVRGPERPLRVFLFGGDEGVAAAAADALNDAHTGVVCVGWHFPGYLSVEELSRDSVINAINSVEADFLVVCLGSKKGQLWLKRNVERLRTPIRAHLGASLNFEAGTVKRAPAIFRRLNLEWLWRIKEEPYLWKRYWHDGWTLLYLAFFNVLPLLLYRIMTIRQSKEQLTVTSERQVDHSRLIFEGAATRKNIKGIISALRATLADHRRILIDLTAVSVIDSRFLGVLLVFRKMASFSGAELVLTGASSRLERIIRLNGADFLLAPAARQSSEAFTLAKTSAACEVDPAFGTRA